MKLVVALLLCAARSTLGLLSPQDEKNIYVKNRLDKVCSANGSKTRLNVKHEVVSLFTFNSSLAASSAGFKCHLELYLPSTSYGFSVFIEEMSLTGSSLSGCNEDYVQFGRDILFVTTHLSPKYCGQVELPVPRSRDGVTSFEFPFTPLARRIYNEEEDREMDIWINIGRWAGRGGEEGEKSLTLVVTPFKKSCATRDSLYQQCRFSTKCVRRELFCDGRINCAWPYVEPADEVHCLEALAPEEESFLVTDLLVIFLVLSLLLAMVVGLVLAVQKYSRTAGKGGAGEEGVASGTGQSCQSYLPSCPTLPPPPPYTALDSQESAPPPSYSLLMPRST